MSRTAPRTPEQDSRASVRANVFLSAVLHLDGAARAVRIRNLSPGGALIETADVPPAGTRVRLQRGPYGVFATVVWTRPGDCGLLFEWDVPLHEWISYGSGHAGQQSVDAIVSAIRAESADSPAGTNAPDLDVAGEIARVTAELDQLARELTAIPGVVEGGGLALQRLDMARQRLVRLLETISG